MSIDLKMEKIVVVRVVKGLNPNEVKRTRFDIPLTDEIINIFNLFHLTFPIEQWENYNEICDFNEKMKELF